MGQVLPGSAATTHSVRAAKQRSAASIAALRDQAEDGGQVAQTGDRSRCGDGIEGAPLERSQP